MEDKLKQIIKDIIKTNYDIELSDIKLEIPPKKEFGDFAFGCFVLSRDLRKSPDMIATELAGLFSEVDLIESVSSAGPYLNIKVSKGNYTELFNRLYEDKQKLIGERNKISKTIVVDYIGTNVGKPLHIGHMCTPNQGQVIINIYRKLGYDVISDSHIGDWGIIFGKLITAFKLYGDENKLKENAVNHLFDLYVKITKIISIEKEIILNSIKNENTKGHNITESIKKLESLDYKRFNEFKDILELEIQKEGVLIETITEKEVRNEFKMLSKGNIESIELWEKFTKESIKSMNKQLNRLNIQPDYDIGESFYEGLNIPKIQNYPDLKYNMDSIVKELIDKKIAIKNDDGSVGVIFPDNTKLPSCILQKRDGTNLYFTSDLCAIKYRTINWDLDKIIYFVDVRQQLHLKQAFEIAKMAGWIEKQNGEKVELFHAYNGFISLKDGAMSTRTGRIIKLDALLDEAELRAKNIILEKRDDIQGEELDELAKIIGIGAIKYGYLKKSRDTDVVFDWDEFMTFEGNSGPYIQYAYVRAIRILEKNDIFLPFPKGVPEGGGIFSFPEEIELIKLINSYDEVLEKTAKTNMPHHLCSFAYELTKSFNSFYNSVHILSETDESKKQIRLQLVELFSLVLKDSFKLLGINMPEKM